LSFLKHHPDVLIGIVGGAFAAGLAFGYIIYTIYDTIHYDHLAMDEKRRPLLRYMANHIDNWGRFTEAKQKMFMEMIHTSGENIEDCNNFYSIGRGFWSHFNARMVCYLWVPIFSVFTLALLVSSDFIIGVRFLSLTSPHIWLYTPVIVGIIIVSTILWFGASRPFNEATRFEYLFIRRRIETDYDSFLHTCEAAGAKWLPATIENEEDYDDISNE
jgi:hypothetical protein